MPGDLVSVQHAMCERFGAGPVMAAPTHKVGVARNLGSGELPLNGLRHTPEEGTSGWFFWAGTELSAAADFFVPMHVSHLADLCPELLPYLLLPPGWRVLIGPGHEDVWFDQDLLT